MSPRQPPATLRCGLPERGRRNSPPNHARECDDRERVRNHLDKLRRNELRSLQLNLQRFRRGKQQARQRRTEWIPPTKDRGCKGNETTARRHLGAEPMLIEREIRPAERRQQPR